MICSECSTEISDDPRADNRYRFCEPCGWALHHGCWIELLSDDRLPCPRGPVESYETRRMVKVEPPEFTATGRRRRKVVTEVAEYRDILDGHGDGIGMLGDFSFRG